MFPNNDYAKLIEKKLSLLELDKIKIFKYSPDPEVLTGEIEILTNYDQRKKFSIKKKMQKTKMMSNQSRL